MVTTIGNKALSVSENIDSIESEMLNLPQAHCPVSHFFAPGIYIRQLTMLAGTTAIGHYQKYEHMNVMIKGKVAIIDGDEVKVLEAPLTFVGKPGRKIGYIIEDCIWQNVYATDETDIDKLEDMFLEKSEAWHDKQIENYNAEDDKNDFFELIEDFGFSPELVKEQSENEEDQIEMPLEFSQIISVRESNIHGKGVFASWDIPEGTIIAPGRIKDKRTPVGRYTNHSKIPNCKFVKHEGDIYIVALKDISGCKGGDKGEELTVNYREALELQGLSPINKKELKCHH